MARADVIRNSLEMSEITKPMLLVRLVFRLLAMVLGI